MNTVVEGRGDSSLAGSKILITGGAGFLGINLVRYLLGHGYAAVTSLDIVPFDYPERERIEAITGDIRDRGTVERAVAGARWLIHAAAALPLYRRKDILSTEVDGTRRLLEAAETAQVERFIYISSTAVYGVPEGLPADECSPLGGVGAYGRAKIEAEHLCEQYRGRGMCIPILRPKSFVGPERLGAFELLYSWAQGRRGFPVIGPGTNHYQLLDVEDLCRAIHLCATIDQARVNATFNIGAEKYSTLREDFQSVLDQAGHGKRIVSVPRWIAVPALRLLEFLHLSPLYRWIYETAGKDSVVSVDKARRELGFRPRWSNQDALCRNYRWYLDSHHQAGDEVGVSHRKPWKQGILRVVKKFF
jgi:nucleoside-diphosphate-sugar epimerase